jgi:hypothetical protein
MLVYFFYFNENTIREWGGGGESASLLPVALCLSVVFGCVVLSRCLLCVCVGVIHSRYLCDAEKKKLKGGPTDAKNDQSKYTSPYSQKVLN